MTPIETWIESAWAGAIGWTLLHSLWQGAIVAGALAAVLAVTRPARARYAAACAAMVLLVAASGLTLTRMMPEEASVLRPAAASAFAAWSVEAGSDRSGFAPSGLAAAAPWLALFWMAGAWIFYLRHAAGWLSVRRLRERGVCSAPERWQQELERLSGQLRVSRPVRLLESSLADAPVVLGHVRPVILMPLGLLAGLPAGHVEAILLHELAHIRRHDYLVNLVQRLVEGLFFYHPAAWWISRVIRAERENCCDDMAVAIRGDAHEYAMALAALEETRWPGREPALAATGGSLVKRIRRLLYPKGPIGSWTPLAMAAILLVMAALALAAWQAPQQGSAAAQAEGRAGNSRYDRWLNEDVVYIIADEERAAFRRLTSDEERVKFIEQFWQRRDPTPGTARNETKEEHYRRIAYANERFGASAQAGWKTDRGRIYIVYGPPDEIEEHWKTAQTPSTFQVWTYRRLEGIGELVSMTFVDRTGKGDYRLAPGKAR
jgi:GWxTD domain-containing protein